MRFRQWIGKLSIIGRTWGLLGQDQGHKRLWAIGVAGAGVYATVAAWLSKQVIDAILRPSVNTVLGIPNAFVYAIVYGLVTLLYGYISSKAALELLTIRDTCAAAADQLLMQKAASAFDITEFEVSGSRDKIRLATVGGKALPVCFTGSVEVLQYVITIIGLSVILFYYHPLVAAIVLLPSIPLFYAQMAGRAHTFGALVNNMPRYRQMGYFIGVILGAPYAKEVRAYRSGGFFLNKYQRTADDAFAWARSHRWRATVNAGIWGAVAAAGIGGAYLYIIYLAARGAITIGDVVMYSGAAFYAGASMRGLIQAASSLWSKMLEAEAFFVYLDEKRNAPDGRAIAEPIHVADGSTAWSVSNISFAYPGGNGKVLDGVSFRIRSRERVAIVGLNGAGKTTLMKLMLRLLEPDEGSIQYRGVDLRAWDVRAFRDLCGVVFQDITRFKLTLHENIALAVNRRSPEDQDEAVLRAARLTGVDEIAEGAPQVYATHLSKEFFEGIELSGGQWQKVALARGLARDPEVVFLDEPNVSLDPRSEHAMFEQLLSVAHEKTTIVISHRFAITPMVDRILVLERGRLIEEGRHDELMRSNGAYARLYKAQAGMYWPDAKKNAVAAPVESNNLSLTQ